MSYPKDVFSRMFAGTHDNKGAQHLLYPKDEEETKVDIEEVDEALRTNIFNVMLGRKSQRKFDETRLVEDSKVEIISQFLILLLRREDSKDLKSLM